MYIRQNSAPTPTYEIIYLHCTSGISSRLLIEKKKYFFWFLNGVMCFFRKNLKEGTSRKVAVSIRDSIIETFDWRNPPLRAKDWYRLSLHQKWVPRMITGIIIMREYAHYITWFVQNMYVYNSWNM